MNIHEKSVHFQKERKKKQKKIKNTKPRGTQIWYFMALICLYGSQLAKMKKVDSLHIPAIKFMGRSSWSEQFQFQLYFKK